MTRWPLRPQLGKEIPEIAADCRLMPWFTEMLVSYDSIKLNIDDVVYADNSALTMFNFPLVTGDKKTALAEPFTAVITETTAKKYFGNRNPMGKTLMTLNDMPVKINGVAKDVPQNSSILFNMLISMATLEAPANKDNFGWMSSWTTNVDYTFVQVKQHADVSKAGSKISTLLHANFPEQEFKSRTYLQPLNDKTLGTKDILNAETFRPKPKSII